MMISKDYEKLNQLKEKVLAWQLCDYVHPLTCGNDSRHDYLVASFESVDDVSGMYEIKLKCNGCDWVQEIPDFIYSVEMENLTGNKDW